MDSANSGKKHCTYCGEEINPDWRRCPFCGSLVEDNSYKIENAVQSAQPEGMGETDSEEPGEEIQHIQLSVPKTQTYNYEREKKPLSNAMKVFITTISTIIPGLGQLIGLITAIVFMNSEDDADRRSFGAALLITTLIVFILSCLYCSILIMAFAESVTQ